MAKDYRREVIVYGKYEGTPVVMSMESTGSVPVYGAAGVMTAIEFKDDEELTTNNLSTSIAIT